MESVQSWGLVMLKRRIGVGLRKAETMVRMAERVFGVGIRIKNVNGVVAWIGKRSGTLGQNTERLPLRCRTSRMLLASMTSQR